MKKIAIVMILMLCMILSLGLVACNNGGQLDVPSNVRIPDGGNTLYWDEVKDASGYIVELDGKTTVETNNNFYTYMVDEKGTYKMRVKAKGTGKFTDSKFSETLSFSVTSRLPAPKLMMDKNGDNITISWDAVPNAKEYKIEIGLNLNDISQPVTTDKTSHTINIKADGFNEIGEYKIRVMAVSASKEYSSSLWSNQLSYINSKVVETPKNFVCEDGVFKWESTDTHANEFLIEAVNTADEKKVYSNTTTAKTLSVSSLRIEEPGEYEVTVTAYNTGDERVFPRSSKSNSVKINMLNPVDEATFLLNGNTLSWNPVTGATGYTITATTGLNSSFEINIEDGATNSINLAERIEFKKFDRVGKVYTFEIRANGKKAENSFNSNSVALKKGAYYQYLPKEADYNVEANKAELESDFKSVFPTKVNKEGEEAYYDVKNFPQFMWALSNANGTPIILSANISMPTTEFISPIKSFAGKFDGNGYSIDNVVMTDQFNRKSIAIFGNLLDGAEVVNLVVNGINVKVSDNNLNSGLIANDNKGTIKDVVISGDIRMFNNSNGAGIAYSNNGVIEGVISKTNVTAASTGGIVVENNKTINNVTVIATMNGVTTVGEVYVGSIAAKNSGTITYAVSNTFVHGNTAGNATKGVVGGIVAQNDGTIEYTYFINGVLADFSNLNVKAYAGGFAGINNGTIRYSYIDSKSSIKRQDTTPLTGGFAGQNNGTIANAYSNISVPDSYNDNKAAFVADNTKGTINNVAYHIGKAGAAPMILKGKEGKVDEVSRGFESNKMTEAVSVLGDEFVVYSNFNRTTPVLKNVIYVMPLTMSSQVNRDADLSSLSDIKTYYFGGETKAVEGEIRSNNRAGYQILKYTGKVGDKTITFNRLISVK